MAKAGCINWVKTGYNRWRHEHPHEILQLLPVVPAGTADAAEPSGGPKPHKDGGQSHPVRFKAADLPPALMQMLKTDWTTVVGQRESFQLMLAGAQHLKDMVIIAHPAYDCTKMAEDIEDAAWTEKAWTLFLFEITEALLARPPGIRQMLQYVLEKPTAADTARAKVIGRYAAMTEDDLTRNAGPRAVLFFPKSDEGRFLGIHDAGRTGYHDQRRGTYVVHFDVMV